MHILLFFILNTPISLEGPEEGSQVLWLEQRNWEKKNISFKKHQGNVHPLGIPH